MCMLMLIQTSGRSSSFLYLFFFFSLLILLMMPEEHQSKQQQLENAMINLSFLNWRLFKRCLLGCYCVCIKRKGWWRWSTFLMFLSSFIYSLFCGGWEKMSSSSADEPLSFAPPPVDHNFLSYQFVSFIIFFCSGEFYLGYSRQELLNVSWYQLLHWDFMKEAQSKHRLSKQFISHFYKGWQLTLIF